MSIIRALCLLLVGAMVVAGQEPNAAPQKPMGKPSDLCSVEGVVVKSTTGEGIKRVTVQLIPIGAGQQPYSTLTENNGDFIIRDIAPGRYAINASGNGYMQQASEKGKGNSSSQYPRPHAGEKRERNRLPHGAARGHHGDRLR